ncbi:unnamed protein product [Arabis nemorensis]|uniref:Secreted protein n=1 Tax=Arabis nemorensis TaxID=586526 RepID=A0A565CGB5_9BRAS|nr:unnamed protein product [Arabis nemorensis]
MRLLILCALLELAMHLHLLSVHQTVLAAGFDRINIYNVEDVVLCALPYHDTHAFVRAPPPRSVIVQQCIRDMQASRSKKYKPSKPVVSFSKAVVVELLGSVTTVDGDIVKHILPFVDAGLPSGVKVCLDRQAGASMIVGMLANRAMLNNNLIKRFMRYKKKFLSS